MKEQTISQNCGVATPQTESVPHTSITCDLPSLYSIDFTFIAASIDRSELSVNVEWPRLQELIASFNNTIKAIPAGSEYGLYRNTSSNNCIIYRVGNNNRYPFHLRTSIAHIYISSFNHNPDIANVFIVFNTNTLSTLGLNEAYSHIVLFINELGGVIHKAIIHRCDLCCDYSIPHKLRLPVLLDLKVTFARLTVPYLGNNDILESLIVGSGNTGLRFSLYNKTLELSKTGKTYPIACDPKFLDSLVRLEFQFRRRKLRHLGVNTVDDLIKRAANLLTHATTEFLTLRLPDNEIVSKRSIHPFWADVQSRSAAFGTLSESPLKQANVRRCSADWYIARIANLLIPWAVIQGQEDLNVLLPLLCKQMSAYWQKNDFDIKYTAKAIEMGIDRKS